MLNSEAAYQPNLDDVGNRICAQWIPDDGGNPSSFAQVGPIQLGSGLRRVDAFCLHLPLFSVCLVAFTLFSPAF